MTVIKGDEKRKISVGFIRPRVLEEDTIYVQVAEEPVMRRFATAISLEKFKYYSEEPGCVDIEEGRETRFRFGGLGLNHFLDVLKEMNNAEVSEERYFEDGLKLYSTLVKISSLSDLKYLDYH